MIDSLKEQLGVEENRQQVIGSITSHLANPDNYYSDDNPAYIANVFDLFSENLLTENEQSAIARKFSLPMIDQGLVYHFQKGSFMHGSEGEKSDMLENLAAVTGQIIRLAKRPLYNFEGTHLSIQLQNLDETDDTEYQNDEDGDPAMYNRDEVMISPHPALAIPVYA